MHYFNPEAQSYHNMLDLFRDVSSRMNLESFPMITTDGFEFYEKVIRRVFGPACLYGQVIKTRRNDRGLKVERRTRLGSVWRWEQVLRDSKDSSHLNPSFVERLNLTIRQGSAYLFRRTICQARWKKRREDHLELLRCHYNSARRHRGLRFGSEMRTPAMQAGLARRFAQEEILDDFHQSRLSIEIKSKLELSADLFFLCARWTSWGFRPV